MKNSLISCKALSMYPYPQVSLQGKVSTSLAPLEIRRIKVFSFLEV